MKNVKESLKLYAITDSGLREKTGIADAVEQAIIGGATIIQYREKSLAYQDMKAEVLEIKAVCKKYNVPFIINDYVELAKEIDADGVHVGGSDCSVSEARKILGADKIVGATAKTIEQAVNAQKSGADYLGSGAVFGTTTKNDAKKMSLDLLKEITGSVRIPVVAIGGITNDNILMLKGTGISGAAVVGGIFYEENIKEAASLLRESIEEVLL